MPFFRRNFGFKYNVRLTNQVGIVDSDYYNNIDKDDAITTERQGGFGSKGKGDNNG